MPELDRVVDDGEISDYIGVAEGIERGAENELVLARPTVEPVDAELELQVARDERVALPPIRRFLQR